MMTMEPPSSAGMASTDGIAGAAKAVLALP